MELDVVAMAGERPYFCGLPVVADADDGHFGLLDHVNDRRDASSVPAAHAVDFVHDDECLLHLLLAFAEEGHVVLPSCDHLHTLLVSGVTRVVLNDGIAILICN